MNSKFKKSKAMLALTLIFALLLPNFAFAEDLSETNGAISDLKIVLKGGNGNITFTVPDSATVTWVSYIVIDKAYDDNENENATNFPGNAGDMPSTTDANVHASAWMDKSVVSGKQVTIPVSVDSSKFASEFYIAIRTSATSGNTLLATANTNASGNTNDPLPSATADKFQAADKTYTGSAINAATGVVSPKTGTTVAQTGAITVTGVTGTSAAGTSGTNVGSYTITFNTAGGTDYAATTGLTVTWNITKANTAIPTLTPTATSADGVSDGKIKINNYDNTRTYEISATSATAGFSDATVTAAGEIENLAGTVAGKSYWVRVKENDNYKASAAATTKVTSPKALTPVTAADFQVTNVTYNKAAQVPTVTAKAGKTTGAISNIKVNGNGVTNAANATNAGTYTVSFDVAADANFAAATGLELSWTINKAAITGQPAISGTTAVGDTLTAGKGTMNADLADVDLEWYVDGTATGTTGATYVIKADDNGKKITVKATAKADGNYTGSATSTAVEPGKATITGQPAISGTTAVGDTLTAEKGTMNADLADVTLQWNRDGVAIPGATGETYKITAADLGKNITVSATPKADSAYTAGPVTSADKAIPAQKPDAPAPTVSAGNQKLTVTWTAPFDGGSPITGYKVTIDGVEITPAPTGTSIEITKDKNGDALVNGTEYTITVVATNAVGDSDPGEVKGTPKKMSGSIGGGSSSSGSKYYDVTYKVGKGGTISGSDSESVKANAYPTKTPKVTAKDGYEFKGWSLDGKTIVDPSDVRIKEDTTFTAIFDNNKTADLNKDDHIAYVRGYEDGTFAPNKSITRAEAITIFARLMNEKMDVDASYNSSFSDVKAGAWYANYIGYMEDYNIINGYEDGTFRPDAAITRAEFAAMASRFDKLENTDKNAFTDVAASHWAINSINSAYAKGWIGGYPDGTFRPNQNISRAEVVSIVNNMLEREIDAASIAGAQYKTFPDVATNHWAYFDVIEAANEHDYTKDGNKETWK